MHNRRTTWLREVPDDWRITTIGSLYNLRNEKVSDKDYPPLSVTMKGIVPQLESAAKTDDGDNRKLVLKGDFAINSRSDRRGSCGISAYDGSVSLINTILTPREAMHPGYYNWLFHTAAFADEFYKWGHGIVDDLWTTRWQEMKRIIVPVPPMAEQQTIAAYLDEQCALIDGAIADAKASIEEYKVWKASIIYKTIIKGVTGEENLKYSGIDWLGEVVPNRTICKLKYLCSNITDGSHFSPISIDVGVPYITAKDVHGIGIDFESTNKISETDYRKLRDSGCQPEKGDVLMVKDGATTGRVGLMSSDTACVVLSSVSILRPKADVLSKYLMYLLESEVLQRQIKLSMGGSAMPRITLTKIVDYVAIMCPYEEQTKIVTYLDERCESIDEIINRKQSLVVDLESYKRSLIYEVVTGKRKVVQ